MKASFSLIYIGHLASGLVVIGNKEIPFIRNGEAIKEVPLKSALELCERNEGKDWKAATESEQAEITAEVKRRKDESEKKAEDEKAAAEKSAKEKAETEKTESEEPTENE